MPGSGAASEANNCLWLESSASVTFTLKSASLSLPAALNRESLAAASKSSIIRSGSKTVTRTCWLSNLAASAVPGSLACCGGGPRAWAWGSGSEFNTELQVIRYRMGNSGLKSSGPAGHFSVPPGRRRKNLKVTVVGSARHSCCFAGVLLRRIWRARDWEREPLVTECQI